MNWPARMQEHLFESALLASVFLHFILWALARWHFLPVNGAMPVIEVDLTAPFHPRMPWDTRAPGAAKGAPAPASKKISGVTGPKAPSTTNPQAETTAVPSTAKPVTEKPWILPGPNTKVLEKPTIAPPTPAPVPVGAAPGGTGVGGEGGRGGSGGGTGTGDAIVNRAPRLINVEEIHSLMRSAYPMIERRNGREGKVIVSIGIDEEGRVLGVEIVDSGGESFDEAAKTVARRMKFEPALVRSVPTAVRVKQAIYFRLNDR